MNWHSEIQENYQRLETSIRSACEDVGRSRDSVKLIWVSKTKPIEAVEVATQVGIDAGFKSIDFERTKFKNV